MWGTISHLRYFISPLISIVHIDIHALRSKFDQFQETFKEEYIYDDSIEDRDQVFQYQPPQRFLCLILLFLLLTLFSLLF